MDVKKKCSKLLVNKNATTNYKHDDRNNVIEIHREFEPKQKFPIIMIGGPDLR